jgi:hypothetical protein
MDEAVDQVMGRSSSETGADKAVAIRRSQQKERARLQQDIAQSQQAITGLNEQRSPIAAEVRKVEAEVGPIKYIAAFVYDDTDQTILEKAVTWVIIILIVVFDPLAVILLLSSQISFQDFRKRLEENKLSEWTKDDFDQIAEENLAKYNFEEFNEEEGPIDEFNAQPTDPHPVGWMFNGIPVVYPNTEEEVEEVIEAFRPIQKPVVENKYLDEPLFVQNEEQRESDLWSSTTESITKEEYQEAVAVNLDPYNDAPHPEVAEYIDLVKSKRMALKDVPEEYLLAVKARM